jgi:hypothetical protein
VETEPEQLAPTPRPWRTIWFSPRRTIRAVVDSEVRPSWVPVVALAVLHQVLASILGAMGPDGTISSTRVTMPAIIAGLEVIFGVIVGPFYLAFTGRWFGGDADPGEIRQSMAWSYVPVAVATILQVMMFALSTFLPRESIAAGEVTASEIGAALILVGSIAVYVVVLAWAVVLQVVTLAEVQRFSIRRAIGNLLILFIPLLLLTLAT